MSSGWLLKCPPSTYHRNSIKCYSLDLKLSSRRCSLIWLSISMLRPTRSHLPSLPAGEARERNKLKINIQSTHKANKASLSASTQLQIRVGRRNVRMTTWNDKKCVTNDHNADLLLRSVWLIANLTAKSISRGLFTAFYWQFSPLSLHISPSLARVGYQANISFMNWNIDSREERNSTIHRDEKWEPLRMWHIIGIN